MNIAGMGVVCTRGRGVAALERALEEGWVPPAEMEARGAPEGRARVYAVAAEAMADRALLAKARRADRFTRLSVLAAADAVEDAGLAGRLDGVRTGLVLATALGPHVTTFGFLDGILEFGDAGASPTAFSHSVHNAAASYMAMTLDVRGPTLTVTHFHFAFHQAVLLAQSWLNSGRCDQVLVGATEELGAVLAYVCTRMLTPAAGGRIEPFAFSTSPGTVPGEGSVFFVLTRGGEAAGGYGKLTAADAPEAGGEGRAQILDACGMARDESGWRRVVRPGMEIAGYAPLLGGMLTLSAFHAAVAALMVRRGRRYACPVAANPYGVAMSGQSGPAAWREVWCTQLDCAGSTAELRVSAHG